MILCIRGQRVSVSYCDGQCWINVLILRGQRRGDLVGRAYLHVQGGLGSCEAKVLCHVQ